MDIPPSLWAGINEGGGPCGGPCCPGAPKGGPNGGVSGLPGGLKGGKNRLGALGLKNLSIGSCAWYLSSGIFITTLF
jgi:hypothetical protein